MTTKAQLKEDIIRRLREAHSSDDNTRMQIILEHIKHWSGRYDELDAEAKKVIDDQFGVIEKTFDEAMTQIRELPDDQKKREAMRLYRAAKHRTPLSLKPNLEALEKPTHIDEEVIPRAKDTFLAFSQFVLEFLADITSHNVRGGDLVLVALCYSAIDELLIGFYLAEHGFGPQSFNHSRTAFDILDKVRLFHEQPQHLGLWMSANPDDGKRKLFEFKPSEVRKKLRRKRVDPLYGFLSEQGAHATFDYIRAKVAFIDKAPEEKRMTAKVWMGGSPRKDLLTWSLGLCLHATLNLLLEIVRTFPERLLPEEADDKVRRAFTTYQEFFLDHILGFAREQGLDVSEMEKEVMKSL